MTCCLFSHAWSFPQRAGHRDRLGRWVSDWPFRDVQTCWKCGARRESLVRFSPQVERPARRWGWLAVAKG